MSTACCPVCDNDRARKMFEKGGRAFVRCAVGCEVAWVEPMPGSDELARYYEQAYASGSYLEYSAAEEIRALIAAERLAATLPHGRHGRWLEVGCATGQFLEAAGRAGIDIQGIDVSEQAVERARARGLRADAAPVDEFRTDRPYDTVCAFDVLEHMPDPNDFLARLRSWLVPGGRLALTLPNLRSVWARFLMGRHWFYFLPNEHLFYFSPRSLAALLEKNGFTVKRITRAYKPLTLDYSGLALDFLSPDVGRLVRPALQLLPNGVRSKAIRLYIGEMMAVAERR